MYFKTKGLEKYTKFIESRINKSHVSKEDFQYFNDNKEKITQSYDLKTEDMITLLNNSKTFTPDIDTHTNIAFLNFGFYENVSSFVKSLFKKDETTHRAGYKQSESLIFTKRSFYDPKYEFYDQMKKTGLSDNEITNFVILHEIGHSIHGAINKNGKPFINLKTPEANFINTFTKSLADTWYSSDYNIMLRGNNTIAEGFADLYSLIVIDRLYPKEQGSLIINRIHDLREERYINKEFNEPYNTVGSIKQFIEYRDANKIDNLPLFKNYQNIENFIFSTTTNQLYLFLKDQMTPDRNSYDYVEQHKQKGINFFAGVIYESHRLSDIKIYPSTLKTLEHISSKMGLNNDFTKQIKIELSNNTYIDSHDFFQEGRSEYLKMQKPKMENTSFKERLKSLKNSFSTQAENNDKLTQKNKFK